MINNEWERFGDEIRRTIQNAVDSRDYSRLNQTVSDTIGRAMDQVSRGLKNGGWYRERPGQNGPGSPGSGPWNQGQTYQSYRASDAGMSRPKGQRLYQSGISSIAGGLLLAVAGFVLGAGSLVLTLLLLLGVLGPGGRIAAVGAGVFGVLTAVFAVMAGAGTALACSAGRFRRYVRILQGREYCDIRELAQRTGRSARAVVKDLRKMIRKGWFCQGHLDEQETCLMVSAGAWDQYRKLMDRMRRQKAEQEAARERTRQEYEKLSPEVQKVIQAGDDYVRKIREANDAIPGEEISAKISRMEMLVDRIFDRVEQKPDTVDDIHRLMEYYLPMTIKLLDAYEELDSQPVQGENIISSKREIEKTLDTLNTAFEKLLDDLFQDTAWDVSSDISVLETMLAQEGLTEDALKAGRDGKDR